jgi:hypothetical protein
MDARIGLDRSTGKRAKHAETSSRGVGYSKKRRGCLKLCGGVETDSAQFKQEVIPMKKRTYRSQEINKACVARVVKDREACAATVGIDVGKDDLYVAVRWADGSWSGPWHARMMTTFHCGIELPQLIGNGRMGCFIIS